MEGFSAINGIAQDYFRSSCDILVGGYSSYIYEKWLQLICPRSNIPAICSIKFRPTCLRSFWNTAGSGVWRNQYLSTIWYDFDKHFYILRRKSTHIYDKMYNFMTLKKKKKKKKKLFWLGGFLRSVGRGQSNNLFFLALFRIHELFKKLA